MGGGLGTGHREWKLTVTAGMDVRDSRWQATAPSCRRRVKRSELMNSGREKDQERMGKQSKRDF